MNTDNEWRGFLTVTLYTWAVISIILLTLIIVVDPHNNLFISPPIKCAPIDTNQRFSYPALARNPRFDSVVIGTSTIRLLKPSVLNDKLGGNFVNLAMNAATAYEQSRIFDLFIRHHPKARTIIIGLDRNWCAVEDEYKRFTFRQFPEWLFDENPWNDLLYIYNNEVLEQTVRQLEFYFGHRKPKYGFDGYANFLPPENVYELQRAKKKIYDRSVPTKMISDSEIKQVTSSERSPWIFATHKLLENILSSSPDTAVKILVFVPYHYNSQGTPGSKKAIIWDECKKRIVSLAEKTPNTYVLDFMISSRITREDRNYWDNKHYTVEIADLIAASIKAGVSQKKGIGDLFNYLY